MRQYGTQQRRQGKAQSTARTGTGFRGLEALEARQLFASTGLTGTYFNGTDFTNGQTTRVDPTIDFNWTSKPTTSGLSGNTTVTDNDAFSARWTGRIKAKYSEYYTFTVKTNGGVRLWVNNQLLIDDLANTTSAQDRTKKVMFKAGQQYNIRLDYVSPGAGTTLQLLWSSTRTPMQVISPAQYTPAQMADSKYRISFRGSSSTPPIGYRADNGAVFGVRSGGYSYGWNTSNTRYTFDRNSTLSYSERYDGGEQMQGGGTSRYWHITVPNGTYNVRVVAGDANFTNAYYSIDVNGVAAVRGQGNQDSHWFDGTVKVTVTNGDISLTNGVGAFNNRINFVEITPAQESDKLISWQTVGFSIKPEQDGAATRWVDPNLFTDGWQGYVDANIKPLIAQGYHRFVLHNPFGISPDQGMAVDEYLEAKDAGLNWLTDGFVQAIKPLTDAGIEVIAYIGCQHEAMSKPAR